jgi:general secretion pathway protein L
MTYSDSSATRYLASRSGGLLRAIADSIGAFISDMAAGKKSRSRARATVLVKGQGAEIHDHRKNTISAYDGDTDGLASFVHGNLPRAARKDVTLRFSSENAIVKHLRLPASAQDVLPAILRNKVESLAPWPLPESLWGYQLGEETAPGEIAVDVGIVSRNTALEAIKLLHHGGAEVQRMEIAPHASGNAIILDFGRKAREKKLRSIVTSALASLALCALALGGFGTYLAYSNDTENRNLQLELENTKRALQGETATQVDVHLATANAIFDEKREAPPFVLLVNELTKAVPDGIWLENINYENGKFLITGRGANPDKLVQSLEASPFFDRTAYASAIQRDAEKGVDVFTIAMAVETREAKP